MPVNHSLNLIFIHIPKTGGTSIEYALGMHGDLENIGLEINSLRTKDHVKLFGKGLQHLSAGKIKKIIGSENFQEYYKFSVLRNPFERLVSYVAWLNGKWERKELLSREEFSDYLLRNSRFKIINLQRLPIPQYKFLYIGRKLITDDLLRYENLDGDFSKLKKKIGMNVLLDKRMVSHHHNYQYYYSKEQVKLVSSYYKKDLQLFGYEF